MRPSIITKPLTELVVPGSTMTRGRPLALANEGVCQTVFAPKAEHSRKPDAVQERIEAMYPTACMLELFARRRRVGWDAWGDEVAQEGTRASVIGAALQAEGTSRGEADG